MHPVLAAAAFDPWRWQPHPEVWVLVAGIVGLGWYAVRVVGPHAVRPGTPIVTRRQRRWFVLAVLLLWAAADWPVHDVAEDGLYFVHMFQHLLLTMVVAPLFLLATPTWLARLVVGDGWFAGKVVRRLCHPVVAGVLFNAAFVFTHWPTVVNLSVRSALVHYLLHVLLFAAALLMWMPICGPLPELRLSLPAQMLYLFCQSIVPTLPSAWLIFSTRVVYGSYVHTYQLWGIDPINDQQAAGVLMKLGAGFYLWGLILVLFFRWSKRHEEAERRGIALVTEREVLTWDDVRAELDSLEQQGR
jgi:putative membrane protein